MSSILWPCVPRGSWKTPSSGPMPVYTEPAWSPTNHPDLDVRLNQLVRAVKLVYASTYFQGPKKFAKRVGQRTEEEKMAVIIQQLIGRRYGGPFLSFHIRCVAQSYNYYPFAHMKPEEGCATMALGLGKTVVEGGSALRFSPETSTITTAVFQGRRFSGQLAAVHLRFKNGTPGSGIGTT